MYPSTIVKLLLVISSLIFILCGNHVVSYDDLRDLRCKPPRTIWTKRETKYRSSLDGNNLYAYAICDVGYKLNRPSPVLCVNGLWKNPLPRCERITSRPPCKPLPTPYKGIQTCQNEHSLVGSVCRFRCPEQYSLIGSRVRHCGPNSQWTGVQPQCILKPPDVDECELPQLNQCNQKCINTPGGYLCSCKSGYVLKNSYECEDIDECEFSHLNQCNQKCINTPGRYKCLCESGYKVKNSYECEDIDECQFSHLNQCNQKCINTSGGYLCSCESGYALKNRYECEDINTPGPVLCSCPPGFELKDDNKTCDYVLKMFTHLVLDSNAKSFIADCRCLPGFIGFPSLNISCSDRNECFTNNFGCSHSCINTLGSALCYCPPGFKLKDDNKTCFGDSSFT